MTDFEAVDSAVDDALSRTMAGVVVKWALVAETIDADGGRSLSTCWSESCSVWDAIGMHDAAAHMYRGDLVD